VRLVAIADASLVEIQTPAGTFRGPDHIVEIVDLLPGRDAVASDALATDGVPTDGVPTNGVAVDDAAPDGAAVEGLAA
jgi:hypothetical protein